MSCEHTRNVVFPFSVQSGRKRVMGSDPVDDVVGTDEEEVWSLSTDVKKYASVYNKIENLLHWLRYYRAKSWHVVHFYFSERQYHQPIRDLPFLAFLARPRERLRDLVPKRDQLIATRRPVSVFDGDGDNNTAPLLEIAPRNVRGRDASRKLHLLWRLTAPCTLFHRTPHLTVPRVDLRAGRDANDRSRGRRDELYNAALALRL